MKTVEIRDLTIGNDRPLTIIAGPCQLEDRDHAFMIAAKVAEACAATGAQFVFKGSFDKANRTSLNGKRGIGMEEGLRIFEAVQAEFGCPVITDVHTEEQCAAVAEVVDILQIPAFLCRQTDLLLAAGRTGRGVNIKKGQFLSPPEMSNVADKVASTGNDKVMLCERGTTFGYNNLVADMRGLPTMARTGYPVVMDATHAVAQPGGLGGSSGGQREFAPVLARAAVSLGIAAVFMETHQDPDNAPSDGPNMIYLDQMPAVIASLMQFDALAKADPLRV
ncbi:2-dehydro-3-deoxyphosphooctonate aldolase (KDO 8-P synthase) [Monaibacterium marinum]|uniref:2-dehydro-3-deoxyphosphooctonate aldolase n=1 Tax=Pontivivens marinum TaxID=1690039 RepID=A0A2C9CN79_9RHOB|nr:3-deoxy-8-phosphooctulonate synthase [Monaibacterium marinum]SOH92764.1 2-dehydro-3-deoxyphosphooctonate aldolase (KDO 8-P synthase) [Monaibacterium marinum]